MIDDKWIMGTLVGLFFASFGYTHKVEKSQATKDDVKYIRDRVDAIYDHLITKNK